MGFDWVDSGPHLIEFLRKCPLDKHHGIVRGVGLCHTIVGMEEVKCQVGIAFCLKGIEDTPIKVGGEHLTTYILL